jgi:methyl-accepting chemotaxis protein
VTAAHAGEHGAAFAVVAKELRDLGARTKDANQSIQGIASELSRLLPELRAKGAEIAQLCEVQAAGTKELASCLSDRLQTAYAGIQASLAGAVKDAVERGESIAANCNDVLSHLMFQDRLSQRLVAAERIAQIWATGSSSQEEAALAIQKLRVGAERLAALATRPIDAPASSASTGDSAEAGEISFL